MPGRRPERIAEQIREDVSQIILGEMRDPRVGLATVTDVKVSPDLRHARVFVTTMGTAEQARESLATLNSAAGFIRHQLGAAIKLRYTPELHFVDDTTVQTAARIEEILKEESEKLRELELELALDQPATSPDA